MGCVVSATRLLISLKLQGNLYTGEGGKVLADFPVFVQRYPEQFDPGVSLYLPSLLARTKRNLAVYAMAAQEKPQDQSLLQAVRAQDSLFRCDLNYARDCVRARGCVQEVVTI